MGPKSGNPFLMSITCKPSAQTWTGTEIQKHLFRFKKKWISVKIWKTYIPDDYDFSGGLYHILDACSSCVRLQNHISAGQRSEVRGQRSEVRLTGDGKRRRGSHVHGYEHDGGVGD